ncbi:hypothetical protein AMK32_25705 [Streptomyces sp. CB01883]|nr:hypothetical protein AMK32_25705 [Streptomyces sp. CB01883]
MGHRADLATDCLLQCGFQPVAGLGLRGDPLVEDCQTLQRDPQAPVRGRCCSHITVQARQEHPHVVQGEPGSQ